MRNVVEVEEVGDVALLVEEQLGHLLSGAEDSSLFVIHHGQQRRVQSSLHLDKQAT